MDRNGYERPEDTVVGDIPPQYVHIVGVATHGDHAVVAMLTNEEPHVEPYVEFPYRENGRWWSGGGTGGYGSGGGHWGSGAAVVYRFERVDPNIAAVTTRLGNRERDVPIRNGHLLAVEWGVRPDEDDQIEVVRLRLLDTTVRDVDPWWPDTREQWELVQKMRRDLRQLRQRFERREGGRDGISTEEV